MDEIRDSKPQWDNISQQPTSESLPETSKTATNPLRKQRSIFTVTNHMHFPSTSSTNTARFTGTSISVKSQNVQESSENADEKVEKYVIPLAHSNATGDGPHKVNNPTDREINSQQMGDVLSDQINTPEISSPSSSTPSEVTSNTDQRVKSRINDGQVLIGNFNVNPQDGTLIKAEPYDSVSGYGSRVLEYIGSCTQGMVPVSVREELVVTPRSNLASQDISVERNRCIDESSGELDTTVTSDDEYQPTPGKRKYKRRKFKLNVMNSYDRTCQFGIGIPKPTGDKAEEVVKAAKSLFSKRTRTLYHWLYPSTSKQELKNIVMAAWDTLQDSEKHFYISQVLGRFGFPASNLMVNPQLGGLKGMPTDHLNLATPIISNEAAKRAVAELLACEKDTEQVASPEEKHLKSSEKRKKKRFSRVVLTENGTRAELQPDDCEVIEEDNRNAINIDSIIDDEFQDDPELSRELAQYRINATWSDPKEGTSFPPAKIKIEPKMKSI